jgi:radical SAM protein with 4Fe4S-binding SPASM domain
MSLKYQFGRLKLKYFVDSFTIAHENGNTIPPKFLAWDCSRNCNLNCEHCGAKKEKYEDELTTSEVKRILKESREYGVTDFSVTGGEPILHKDMFEIFEYAKSLGFVTGISTNAFLIDENNAAKIVRLFDTIQISLDGTKQIHNKIRGNDLAFDRVIRAFSLLKKAGKTQLSVSSVITKHNLPVIDELAKIVIDEIKPDIWKILTVMPIGRAEDNDGLALSESETKELFKKIETDYKKRIRIEMGDNLGFLGCYDRKLRDEPFFCPIGFLACCLGVNGKIRGCPEQPDNEYFCEGDLRKQSLRDVWENNFIKYREHKLTDNVTCKKCHDKDLCLGGCWVMKTKKQNCTKETYRLG